MRSKRHLGEVKPRNGSKPTPGATVKQTLRDLVGLRYGANTVGGKRVSNMSQQEMVALLAAARGADIYDPSTGWLRPEIIAEAAELLVDIPEFPPTAPDVEVMPDGRWAKAADAAALRDLAAQADHDARLHDAQTVFAADPLPP